MCMRTKCPVCGSDQSIWPGQMFLHAEAGSNTVPDCLNDLSRRAVKISYANLETFAQAFIGATGLQPEEAELVQIVDGQQIRWYFRKRPAMSGDAEAKP